MILTVFTMFPSNWKRARNHSVIFIAYCVLCTRIAWYPVLRFVILHKSILYSKTLLICSIKGVRVDLNSIGFQVDWIEVMVQQLALELSMCRSSAVRRSQSIKAAVSMINANYRHRAVSYRSFMVEKNVPLLFFLSIPWLRGHRMVFGSRYTIQFHES